MNPMKALRYLRREYPVTSLFIGVVSAIATVIGLSLAFVPGAGVPLAMVPFLTVGAGAAAKLVTWISGGETEATGRPMNIHNNLYVNGVSVIGTPESVASVRMMQRLIDIYTEKHRHEAELPRHIEQKILRHIRDIEPQMAALRGYDINQKQVGTFHFKREVYDDHGVKKEVDIATVLLQRPPAPALPPAQPETSQYAPGTVIIYTPPLAPDFGTLAKKVDDVEKRVVMLENPVPPALDKPKLAGPSA